MRIIFPGKFLIKMTQIYDGNKKGKRPGHFFLPDSGTSLCGFKKSEMKAPVIEAEYTGTPTSPTKFQACKRCLKIAETNIAVSA